jgi:hypothetical protein
MTTALKDATCATAEQALKDFQAQLADAQAACSKLLDALPASRTASIARTNLETGFLWLEQASREFGA